MHSKFVLLLLAALQVSYSSQWERPHIRYYSRWAKNSQSDSYDDHPSRSNYEDSHHRPLNSEAHCRPHHQSDDVKPVHEDQHGDRSISDSVFRDEESHVSGQSVAGDDNFLPRPTPEDCGILVNPIRPPFEQSEGLPLGGISEHSGIESGPASEHLSEGISEDQLQSNAACYPGEGFSSPHTTSVPGGPTNQDIQASITNSAINQKISSAAFRAGVIPENTIFSPSGPMRLTPLLPFLPSGTESSINQQLIRPTLLQPLVAPTLRSPSLPSPNFCIRHRLVPVPIQVVEECITNVPVVRKTLRHQVETVTHHVPVYEKAVTQQHEKIVRHVPVSGKTLRNVVETRVRHIPVIKSRTRTVVEPYTVHIPVTIRYTRPVEESITKMVPIQVVRVRPVVTKRTRFVPVVARRLRPVVEQRIHNVPVKKSYVRTIVEQRVRPIVGPCQPCIVPSQPIGLPMSLIPSQDIPRILLSPYSDITGSSSRAIDTQFGTASPPLAAFSSPFGAAISTGPVNSENVIIFSPINGQTSTPCGEKLRVSYVQPIHPEFNEPSLSPNTLSTMQPNDLIVPNHHETDCHPRSPSC